MSERIQFLNCFFDNVTLADVMKVLDEHVASRKPGFMCSINSDIVVRLDRDEQFRVAYSAADLALMDSEPLRKILVKQGIEVKEKLSGSDLMPKVCKHAAEKGHTCFILGGAEGIPDKAAANLKTKFPGLKISGYSPEYGFDKDGAKIQHVVSVVTNAHPDILFVCLGTPKSEKLIYQHLTEFNVPFSFCVGAAVDFEAGNVKRAPVWMQKAGLEWFYRFLQEPKRMFRRYFIDSWSLISIARRSKKSQ